MLNFTLAAVIPGILLQSRTGVTIQPWSILRSECSTSAAVYAHASCSESSACASWCTSMHFKSAFQSNCSDGARLLERGHAPYVETVPFRIIFAFTLLQLVGLGAVYGITKAGVCDNRYFIL